MKNEAAALKSLATMRDQKVVFFSVQSVVRNSDLSPNEAMERIRELYAAYDEAHPSAGETR